MNRKKVLFILGACGGLLVLVMVCGTTFLLWNAFSPPLPRLPPRLQETAEQKRQAIRAAFFGDPAPEHEVEFAAVRQLFDRLGEALREGVVDQVNVCLDADRLWQEVNRSGQLTGFGKLLEREWLQSLRQSFAAQVTKVLGVFGWARLDIRRVERVDGDELLVYTRRWVDDANGRDVKMRWWLRRREDGWSIYDVEYLGAGFRWSDNLARGIEAWTFVSDPTRIWYGTLEVGECL